MDRRTFLALTPALPGAASATLTIRRDGEPPLELDLNILRLEPGDVLVVQTQPGVLLSQSAADNLKALMADLFPGHPCTVFDGTLSIGVVRPG